MYKHVVNCGAFLQIREIAEQLKIAFKQRTAEKDWLDETTKAKTTEKVANITNMIDTFQIYSCSY